MTNTYNKIDRNPAAPKWKVFFHGNFWGHPGKDHAGREIKIGKAFDWAGHRWLIPAAYSCGRGLVMDFCMRVEAGDIRAFMEKWGLTWENDFRGRTRERQMEMELDNPLCLHFRPELEVNGKKLVPDHGCAVTFNPCLPDGVVCEMEAKQALDHYGLDAAYGWVICRNAFPWGSKRRPEIKTLSLTMVQQPSSIPGPHFQVTAPGDTFAFRHPANGQEYTLTVQELEGQTIPKNGFAAARWEYPTHCRVMRYTVNPEIGDGKLTVMDCVESDRPKEKERLPYAPTATSGAAAVGVIGGADGPTAILYGTADKQAKCRTACSALHFAPVDDVEWRMVFHETQFDKMAITLIEEMTAQ